MIKDLRDAAAPAASATPQPSPQMGAH